MNSLNNQKMQLVAANIAHSSGDNLKMTDREYDELLKEVKSKDASFNPMHYLPVPEGSTTHLHRVGYDELRKFSTNEISTYWNQESGKIKTPKYDGSSIAIYYVGGRLSHILSMSDKYEGIDQTEKFESLVPQVVDPLVSFIRSEVMVDTRLVDNARGKSNGLVNSKYLQSEVEELVTIVAYSLIDYSGYKMPFNDYRSLLLRTTCIHRSNKDIPYFLLSPEIHQCELLEKGYASYKDTDANIDFQFAIDGIVYTEDDSYPVTWAYKYYYLTSAITEVVDISWRETEREGYTSVLVVDTVTLDGKTITNPTTNGVPLLLEKSMGIGSKVEVAFSGTTIPQVISVVSTEKVTLPVCSYCSHQMTEHDIYGSLLKCVNVDCSRKYDLRSRWFTNSMISRTEELNLNNKEYLIKYLEYYLMSYLNVSRFNYDKARLVQFDSIKDQLLADIMEKDVTAISVLIGNSYNWSKLQWKEMLLSLKSTVLTINMFLND